MTRPDESALLDCADAREQISACCDGEAERTLRLDAHLKGCTACRDFAAGCDGVSRSFEPLRSAAPPADLERRLLAGAAPSRFVVLRGGARVRALARIAAGLVGLVASGGLGAWLAARPCEPGTGGVADAAVHWLEPLSGRALHPADAPLRSWSDAMVSLVSEERR